MDPQMIPVVLSVRMHERYRYVHTEARCIVSVNFLSITSCALQGYSKVCVLELTYVHLL